MLLKFLFFQRVCVCVFVCERETEAAEDREGIASEVLCPAKGLDTT